MKKKRINKIMIIVVLFLFMVMGIGYSYLSKTLGVSGNVTVKNGATICKENLGVVVPEGKLCKRAEKLHTEVCNQSDNSLYCSGAGHKQGENIVYGNCGSSGELKSGDAFDCDVDGNGIYDSDTERFYYVSDYYDTTTKSFNSDYATLIYYNNVKEGEANNTATFAYNSSNENWHGPVIGYAQLPSTSQWSKVMLLKDTRQLLNEIGGTTTNGGILGTFTYTDKVARLLTVQEIYEACGMTEVSYTTGELDTCEYLLENTYYSTNGLVAGWWTESARSLDSSYVWDVSGYYRRLVYFTDVFDTGIFGFRPAIDVLKTDILY